jgi:exonuclease III
MNQAMPPPGVSFVLQNVCGLTGRKLLDMLSWMREKHFHAAVLTETCTSSDPADLLRRLPGAGAFWPGARFFHVPGTGPTEGVTVILGPDCHLLAPAQFEELDGAGRVLRLDLRLLDHPVSLLGVYAPAQPGERARFFRDVLPAYLTGGVPLLVGIDANCVLDLDLDCVPSQAHRSASSRRLGANELRQTMEQFSLLDIWRRANAGDRAFTHWSAPAGTGARLDRWLASTSFLDLFKATTTIMPAAGIATDHLPVALSLQATAGLVPRGTGIQAFPLQLLSIPAAVQELEAIIHIQMQNIMQSSTDGIVKRWDNAKAAIRMHSLQIFRRHRMERRSEVSQAEAAAQRAWSDLVRHAGEGDEARLASVWRQATGSVHDKWQSMTSGALTAAQTLDQLFSDTSSYYFHAQVRQPHAPTTLITLNKPGRGPSDDPAPADLTNSQGCGVALGYAASFYASTSPCGLFRPNEAIDAAAQSELLGSLSRRLPPSLAALAEGVDDDSLLTAEDFEVALAAAQRGSTPGYDGLPYEFYRAFREPLTPALIKVYNAAFQDTASASPLARLLRGVICLIPKAGQPAEELSSYRPITLLNCDVKLVMLIMSNRLQRPLDYLIDITQSAFIAGRDISDNVRYHLGLASRLQELGLPGWLLHSDLTKAYDSVDRGWLLLIMQAMGLKADGIVRWSRILLNGSSAMVRVNGFLTPSFQVTSGLFQGSSLSCQEWVMVLQPLVSYLSSLQHSGQLTALPLPCGRAAPAAMAHADDTKMVLTDPDTHGLVIKAAFLKARSAGNPAQSAPKTILLHLAGAMPATLDPNITAEHAATGFRLKRATDPPHRLLGVPFTRDLAACTSSAFGSMAGAMRQAAKPWITLRPTVLGRAHVAMQCLASKAVYMCNFVTPDAIQHVAPMQRAINSFVASCGRREEETPFSHALCPRFAVSRLPCAAGGLGVTDLDKHATAMRAKPCWQALLHSQHPWAQLFGHEVSKARPQPHSTPSGHHWIVTAPQEGALLSNITTPYMRDAVLAFRRLKVSRIMAPASQDFQSVMQEHTFDNSAVPLGERLGPSALTTLEGRSWLRLRQVRAAWVRRAALAPAVHQDLMRVLDALPHSWKDQVTSAEEPESDWTEVYAPDDGSPSVFEGPDPMSGEVGLWELWPGGRLHPLSVPFVRPNHRPRPALVHTKLKPKYAWKRSDWTFHEAQLALPSEEREEIKEPWLIGVWEDLQLDPRVWGFEAKRGTAEVRLLDFSVKRARTQLSHVAAMSSAGAGERVLGYSQAGAAWPDAWEQQAMPATTAVSAAGEAELRRMGLRGLEERWRRTIDELDFRDQPQQQREQPAWLRPPGERAAPRPSPADRQAARDATPAGPAGELPDAFVDVWPRLCDPTLHRPYRITCWRILHGCLGCNAFLTHVRSRSDQAQSLRSAAAACQAPCCLAGTRPMETLTHAFLQCPEAAPVVDWLVSVWYHLAGAHVPRTAAVLLADDPRGWAEAPQDKWTYRLWTRLRVATLGAIWRVRCARDEGGDHASFAHKAASQAVEAITSAIARDWSRTHTSVRALDGGAFCTDWWRGFDGLITVTKFEKQWARPPILCRLDGDRPNHHLDEDTRTLHVRLSDSHPIPIPPAQPLPPPPPLPQGRPTAAAGTSAAAAAAAEAAAPATTAAAVAAAAAASAIAATAAALAAAALATDPGTPATAAAVRTAEQRAAAATAAAVAASARAAAAAVMHSPHGAATATEAVPSNSAALAAGAATATAEPAAARAAALTAVTAAAAATAGAATAAVRAAAALATASGTAAAASAVYTAQQAAIAAVTAAAAATHAAAVMHAPAQAATAAATAPPGMMPPSSAGPAAAVPPATIAPDQDDAAGSRS